MSIYLVLSIQGKGGERNNSVSRAFYQDTEGWPLRFLFLKCEAWMRECEFEAGFVRDLLSQGMNLSIRSTNIY